MLGCIRCVAKQVLTTYINLARHCFSSVKTIALNSYYQIIGRPIFATLEVMLEKNTRRRKESKDKMFYWFSFDTLSVVIVA